MIYNILVPIDGSKPSIKALDMALSLAEMYSANLVVLNVVPAVEPIHLCTSPSGAAISLIGLDSYLKGTYTKHEAMLADVLQNAKNLKPHVNISIKLEFGNPAKIIILMAKLGNFDLIVMGHRGLSKIRELVLGSVSHQVVHNAECSVMIIK